MESFAGWEMPRVLEKRKEKEQLNLVTKLRMKLCLDIVLHDSNLKKPQIVKAAPLKKRELEGYLTAKHHPYLGVIGATKQQKKTVGGKKGQK